MIENKIDFMIFFKPKPLYFKKSIMSKTEIMYYDMIKEIIGDNYVIWPQINLGAIVKKKKNKMYKDIYNYQNELNRIIDYGIFDKKDYELKLLIELNDYTHSLGSRKHRDNKVKSICDKCGYNIITIFPDQTKWQIEKTIVQALDELQTNIYQTNDPQSTSSTNFL